MERLRQFYFQADDRITLFLRRNGILFLRISLGIVFFWFGFLKFFPGVSPADQIATETISKLTFGIIEPNVSIIILAVWETLIGIGLLSGKYLRITLLLLFVQMMGKHTMTDAPFKNDQGQSGKNAGNKKQDGNHVAVPERVQLAFCQQI